MINPSDMNQKTLISGTSILLIVLALGRMFISYEKDKIKEEDKKLFDGIRTRIKESKVKSTASIDSLLKLQGRIFIYSNDRSVQAGWVPNNLGSYIGGSVRNVMIDALDAEKFVKKKDSLGFLLLLNCGGKNVFIVNKGILFDKEKGNKALWFMGFDKENRLPKDSAKVKKNPELYKDAFVSTWGIGFDQITDLSPAKLTNLPMVVSSTYLNKIKGYKFYMAGYEKDNNKPGIDSLSFVKSVDMVNTLFKKEGVDLKQFKISSFKH